MGPVGEAGESMAVVVSLRAWSFRKHRRHVAVNQVERTRQAGPYRGAGACDSRHLIGWWCSWGSHAWEEVWLVERCMCYSVCRPGGLTCRREEFNTGKCVDARHASTLLRKPWRQLTTSGQGEPCLLAPAASLRPPPPPPLSLYTVGYRHLFYIETCTKHLQVLDDRHLQLPYQKRSKT